MVGYKPSVGAIGRAGIIPLVPSQDAAGFLGRCVADVVLAVRAVSGADPRDSVSLERAQQLREGRARLPDSLESVRIGVPRKAMADREQFSAVLPHFQRVLDALAVARATIIDPCDLPSAEQLQEMRSCVFATEFKASVNAFLEDHLAPCGIGSLADLIAWNSAHPECIPYGQSLLINAQNTIGLHHDDYLRDRARDIALSRTAGIDAALGAHNADVLLAPMGAAAKCTGKAGAPTLAIPFGVDVSGTPFGVTLYSRIGNDRALEAVAALVERAVGNRVIPRL